MIDPKEVARAITVLRVVWVAMILPVFVYCLVIPRFLGDDYTAPLRDGPFPVIRAVLYLAALLSVLLARFLHGYVLSGRAKLPPNSAVPSHPAIQRYASATLLALAVSESVALYGLVLYILGRDRMSLYLLGATAILSMLLFRPGRDDLVEAARQFESGARRSGGV